MTTVSIDTIQLIERLIEFAKELRDDPKRAEQMGLSEDEVAFYDAFDGEPFSWANVN